MRPEADYFEEAPLGKAADARVLGRLLPFVRPERRLLAGSIALVVLITLVELSLPYLTKTAIDRHIVPPVAHGAGGARVLRVDPADPEAAAVLARRPGLGREANGGVGVPYAALAALAPAEIAALRGPDLEGIASVVGVFLALALADFLLTFLQALAMEAAGQRIMHGLRLTIYRHIQDLPLDFFTRNPVGRLVTRATADVQNMYELFTSFVSFVFKDLVLLAGIAAVMFALNWRLALVTLFLLPAVAAASARFSRRAREVFRRLRVEVAEINTRFAETIGGIRAIQLFRAEAENARRFRRLNHQNYLTGMEQIRVLAVFMPLIEALAVAATALLVWIGGIQVLGERLSLGALVAFIAYVRMFFRPLRDLAEKYNILQNAMASAERILLVLDTPGARPPPGASPAGRRPPEIETIEELRFEAVDFGYIPGEPVLKGVSFALGRGETLAVVGPTGAGKTSLMHLIPRLYDPWRGRVTINGRDLRELPAAAFRDRLALVMQEPLLFSGTIRENIFGTAGGGRMAPEAVLEAARLEALIARLPQGLDTELGEAGGSISTGERQLIAIARAIARDPQLILFDEATSAVDSQTERWIQEALANLMRRRTTLVVAHRLSTVRAADRILVLHRGRIIESGPHAELMARQGFYFRLHQIQSEAGALAAQQLS
jgi:ATP-binding cassette subfamily B protein